MHESLGSSRVVELLRVLLKFTQGMSLGATSMHVKLWDAVMWHSDAVDGKVHHR